MINDDAGIKKADAKKRWNMRKNHAKMGITAKND